MSLGAQSVPVPLLTLPLWQTPVSVLEVDLAWCGNGIGAGGVLNGPALVGGWQMGLYRDKGFSLV